MEFFAFHISAIGFSQERLNEAQDLARMGNWDKDLRTGEIYQPDGLYRLFGFQPGEVSLTNECLNDLIHPDHRGLFRDFLGNTFSGNRPADYEFCFYRNDGEKRYAFAQTRIITDSSDQPIRVSGTLKDVTEFKVTEKALREKEKALLEHANSLQEMNTALKVLLDHREAERAKFEEDVLGNVKNFVMPYLDRLKRDSLGREQKTLLDILESNLAQLTASFATKLSSETVGLTPRELEVANLVRDGRQSKEIAEILCISENAVRFHRFNIRRKLGVNKKGLNLRSYLQHLPKQ